MNAIFYLIDFKKNLNAAAPVSWWFSFHYQSKCQRQAVLCGATVESTGQRRWQRQK
jgi:hypothetical protein